LAIEFINVVRGSFVTASGPVCEDVSVEHESAQEDGHARKQNVAQPAKHEELSPKRGHDCNSDSSSHNSAENPGKSIKSFARAFVLNGIVGSAENERRQLDEPDSLTDWTKAPCGRRWNS
jgi:hypothetical protein